MNELTSNDDNYELATGNNFGFCHDLEADVTYILGVRYYNSGYTGSFDVSVAHYDQNMDSYWDPEQTCTQDGTWVAYCNICGYNRTTDYPAGHSYEMTVESEADCTTDGVYIYTCGGCGDTYTETIGAYGHSYGQTEYVDATCTEDGYAVYTCWRCNADSYTETIGAYGHDYYRGQCNRCDEYQELGGDLTDTITWTISGSDGVLHVEGTGAMPDFDGSYAQPWYDYHEWIVGIEVCEGITEVGNYAFNNVYCAETVSLPSTLTRIGMNSFTYCSSLTEIDFPAELTVIEDSAFWGSGLTQVTVPGSVDTISYAAFRSCDDLVSVTLEDGVVTIADYAFTECYNLETVHLSATLDTIGCMAFQNCTSLRSIELPASLTCVNDWAFSNTGLESVVIPASVTVLGCDAFENCASLTSITVEEGNTVYTSVNGVVYTDSGTNLWIIPSGLKTVTIEAGVTVVNTHIYSVLQTLIFTGNVPEIWWGDIENTRLTIYYPADNTTWTEEAIANMGKSEYVFEPLPEIVVLSGPTDTTVEAGETVTFSVVAQGAVSYSWQCLDEETGEWYEVGNGADWTWTPAYEDNGKVYQCVVTNSEGTLTAYSANFCLTVLPVQEIGELEQSYSMEITAGSYGVVRFTADYTGMYILHLDYDLESYYLDTTLDLPDDKIISNWGEWTVFLAEEGVEYNIHVNNSSTSEGGDVIVWVDLRKPVTLAAEEPVDVALSLDDSYWFQFTAEEAGWYAVYGLPGYGLYGKLEYETDDEGFYWLEAGQTFYCNYDNYEHEKTLPVTMVRKLELQVGDTISGTCALYSVTREVFFTPETTGLYRLVSDNANADIGFYEGGGIIYSGSGFELLEAGVRYQFRILYCSDDYGTYNVTLEEIPMVEAGYTGTIDSLAYGEEYMVGFTPEVTDRYIITAYAADGTRVEVYVDNQGGSMDDWILNAGEMVTIRFNNQSGADLTDITVSVQRQPVMERSMSPIWITPMPASPPPRTACTSSPLPSVCISESL